jgi:hypothetical protein
LVIVIVAPGGTAGGAVTVPRSGREVLGGDRHGERAHHDRCHSEPTKQKPHHGSSLVVLFAVCPSPAASTRPETDEVLPLVKFLCQVAIPFADEKPREMV